MRTKILPKTIYIADDGTEFDSETECQYYENQKMDKMVVTLSNLIRFYDGNGKLMSSAEKLRYYTPTFAHVLRAPSNESESEAWNEYVPYALADHIFCDTADRWFVTDENDHWAEWGEIQSDYRRIEAIIERLKKGG